MALDTAAQTPRKPPKFVNQLVSFLLRSPLHGLLSNSLMLLTYRGRKSGKMYTLPVGYVRQGDMVELLTDHNWWKNLSENGLVTVYLKGKKLKGTAEVVHENKEAIAEGLMESVRLHPQAARAYRVKLDPVGQPDIETVRQATLRFTLVRIHLP